MYSVSDIWFVHDDGLHQSLHLCLSGEGLQVPRVVAQHRLPPEKEGKKDLSMTHVKNDNKEEWTAINELPVGELLNLHT